MTKTDNVGQDPVAQLATLTEAARRIKATRLPKHISPAERMGKSEQRRVLAEVDGVRAGMALSGTLATIAEQIGFGACPLDSSALRGALLGVLDSAKNPDAVAQFYARDAQYVASKKKAMSGIRVFVPVANPPPEIRKAATGLGLRFDGLAGAFQGRVKLDDILEFGQQFDRTVRTQLDGETVELVIEGKVDDAVLAQLRAQAAIDPSSVSSKDEVEKCDKDDEEPNGEAGEAQAASTSVAESSDAMLDHRERSDQEVTPLRNPAPRTGFSRAGLRNAGTSTT